MFPTQLLLVVLAVTHLATSSSDYLHPSQTEAEAVKALEPLADFGEMDKPGETDMERMQQFRDRLARKWKKDHRNDTEVNLPDRVIGGSDAMPREAPFQAQLFLRVGGNSISFTCGGSIINSRTILTAAHCVETADYRIRYGSNSRLYSPYPLSEVATIRRHPGWSMQTLTNDVALFILKSPIKPSSNVKAIDVVQSAPSAGTDMTLYGFGLVNGQDQNSLAFNLQRVGLRVASERECANFIASAGLRKGPGHLCAGAPNRGSCNGDSGGPLIVAANGLQAGIVSFGINGCPPGALDVFTNVAYYLDWIKANMAKEDNGNDNGGNDDNNKPSNPGGQVCEWVCRSRG